MTSNPTRPPVPVELRYRFLKRHKLMQVRADVEKLADRMSPEIDPQIGRVKDMSSAAVGLIIALAGLVWLLAFAERFGLI